MKRYYYILTLITLLVCGGMTSCSDDIEYRTEEKLPTGIYLTIPDVAGALDNYETRDMSGGDPRSIAEKEGTLNDLYVYVYRTSGTQSGTLLKGEPIDLLESTPTTVVDHNSDTSGTKAKTYNITEWFKDEQEDATYHIYLVANLGAYAASGWNSPSISEDQLKAKLLNFKSGTDYLLHSDKINETGLPMACLHDDIDYGEGSNVKQLIYKKNKTSTVHADMKFLCSKVRYTILFDNSTGTSSGFSTAVFGGKAISDIVANATSLNNGSQTIGSDAGASTSFFDLNSIHCASVTYPENPDTYPSADYNGNDQRFSNLEDIKAGGNKRAWQGVVYLPANPDLTKPTRLEFKATLEGSEQVLTYTLPLVPPTGTETAATALRAGNYYDIVAKVKGLEQLSLSSVNVMPWSREQLVYTLAQNLYLNLSTTSIDKMETGQDYTIWYETSGGRITAKDVNVPKYITAAGRSVDLFVVSTKPGDNSHIYISINPDIESDWFQNITNGKQGDGTSYDFKWIEIKACGGIINKKIEIEELDLHRFLTLSTRKMYINVHELTSSGYYDNPETTEFEVETNIHDFWVQMVNWPGESNDKENRIWIQVAPVNADGETLRDENGNILWNDDPAYLIPMVPSGSTVTSAQKIDNGNGVRMMRLRYTGLNSGYPLWNETQTLTLSFRVDNTNFTGNNYVDPTSFTVSILPDSDKYIIHFKSKNNYLGTSPHIYVYQCLEIPSYVTTEYKGEKLGGMPIAGTENAGKTNQIAALEYSFTGGIAFRGWDWDKNKATLSNIISGDKSVIDEKLGDYIQLIGDWNEGTNSEQRYNTSMDFMEVYRNDPSRCTCSSCRGSGYFKGWPGIIMESEGNGWFKLELPGIATPGRALIIWTDGHNNYNGVKQYPSSSSSGIRLFDYPSKEAWFYYDNDDASKNKWYASKAAADAAGGGGTISDYSFKESNGWIYFSNPSNWGNVSIHYWGGTTKSEWPGMVMKKMTIDGKQVWAYKIPVDTEYVIFHNGSSRTGDITIDDSTNYYMSTGKQGEALSDAVYGSNWDTWPTDKPYRFYWKGNNDRLWVWTKNSDSSSVEWGSTFNGDSSKDYDNTPQGIKDGDYHYKQYKLSKPANIIYWKFTSNNNIENSLTYKGNESKIEEHSSYYKVIIKE